MKRCLVKYCRATHNTKLHIIFSIIVLHYYTRIISNTKYVVLLVNKYNLIWIYLTLSHFHQLYLTVFYYFEVETIDKQENWLH